MEADLAVGSAHNNLMDVRKKYDDMKKQCLNKETTIFNLKVIFCQSLGGKIKVLVETGLIRWGQNERKD